MYFFHKIKQCGWLGLGPDGPCLPQSAGVAQRLLMAQELRRAVDR